MINADLSQIELRVAAHFSHDPAMCDAFKSGRDLHIDTAANLAGIAYEDFILAKNKDKADMTEYDEHLMYLRSMAKAVNFGLLYGQGAKGLARGQKIKLGEATNFLNTHKSVYAATYQFINGVKTFVKRNGYIRTIYGKKRHLQKIWSKDREQSYAAESTCVNNLVQGTAGDIMKVIMIKLFYEILPKYNAKMVSQIHDELIIICPEEVAEECAKEVKYTMINTVTLSVPMDADVVIADNWGVAH